MTKARRARPQPTRVILPALITAVLLAGGGFAASQLIPNALTRGQPPDDKPPASAPPSVAPASADPKSAVPKSTDPDQETPTPKASPDPAPAPGAAEVEGCVAKVLAADAVLSRADTAVGHWAEHVQAQTNANSGKVTLEEMKATWKRTRLLGPDDVKQYSDALGDYQREKGSCRAVEEASAETTKTLTACADRFKKLSPALEAADAGVGDWKKHLADMQRSAGGHVDNAQTVWLETWAKAPPNIDTFEAATKAVKEAPTCA